MTLAIRAELLFDEREVVVSALNRTMLIDPDSSTQRYLNNPSGYAMWDVNKHRNSHLQASWVYQRQFYTVHVEKCFTQSCVLQSGEPCCEQLSLLRILSYLFMRLSPVTSLSQFEICCWHEIQNTDVNVETSGFQMHSFIPLMFLKILLQRVWSLESSQPIYRWIVTVKGKDSFPHF